MANIKSLKMADAISSNKNIEIKKSLWHGTKVTYTKIGSPVKISTLHFTGEAGKELIKLLHLPIAEIAEKIKGKTPFSPQSLGNVRIELCHSRDNQFAAGMAFRYADFKYVPVSETIICEGTDAETLMNIFTM